MGAFGGPVEGSLGGVTEPVDFVLGVDKGGNGEHLETRESTFDRLLRVLLELVMLQVLRGEGEEALFVRRDQELALIWVIVEIEFRLLDFDPESEPPEYVCRVF